MNSGKEKSPDRIRRETVPVKHHGLIYGFLGGALGAVFWFGGWGLLHQEQVRRYPAYCTHAIRASVGSLALFGKSKRPAGLSGGTANAGTLSLVLYSNSRDQGSVSHDEHPVSSIAVPSELASDVNNEVYAWRAEVPPFRQRALIFFPAVCTLWSGGKRCSAPQGKFLLQAYQQLDPRRRESVM